MASLPSTCSEAMPLPIPLYPRDGAAVCLASGVLMAYLLLWMRNTTGALNTAAKLSASWKSPSLVAPSPTNAIATVGRPLRFSPEANPTAWISCVAKGVLCGAVRHALGSKPQWAAPWGTVRISTGSMPRGTRAMESRYVGIPTYRDSMALVTRGIDPVEILTVPHGAAHCGFDPRACRTAPQSTPLATQLIHAVGFASGEKRKGRPTVAMAFVGDGATSEGDFHEALNFAAVFKAPIVFLVQSNKYAISTPLSKQTAAPSLGYKGIGYGIASEQVDGNDAMAVLAVLNKAVAHARSGQGPVLVEAHTYRLDAHTNADDATRYRVSDEVDEWLRRDPIARLEAWLRHEALIDDAFVESVAQRAEVFAADLRMRMSVDLAVDPMSLFDNVFATPTPQLLEQRTMVQAELEAEEASR